MKFEYITEFPIWKGTSQSSLTDICKKVKYITEFPIWQHTQNWMLTAFIISNINLFHTIKNGKTRNADLFSVASPEFEFLVVHLNGWLVLPIVAIRGSQRYVDRCQLSVRLAEGLGTLKLKRNWVKSDIQYTCMVFNNLLINLPTCM